MICLEKGIPEGIQELKEPRPVYLFNEIRCFFLCAVQNSQDQLLVGKEQVPEDIKCGMGDLIRFTDLLYGMGMQEIGFQHGQDEAQAVGRIRDQHLGKKGMGMPARSALYPWDTQDHCHWPAIL